MSYPEQNAMTQKYAKDFEKYLKSDKIQQILGADSIKIRPGTQEEDTKLVADCVCTNDPSKNKLVSLRVSGPYKGLNFPTNTFRTADGEYGGYDPKTGIFSGPRMEFQKIYEGYGDYHATLFVNRNGEIIRYTFLGFGTLRISGLLDYKTIIQKNRIAIRENTKDSNGFISYDIKLLDQFGCILDDYRTVYDKPEYWKYDKPEQRKH